MFNQLSVSEIKNKIKIKENALDVLRNTAVTNSQIAGFAEVQEISSKIKRLTHQIQQLEFELSTR